MVDDFEQELRKTFLDEAEQLLEELEAAIMAFESGDHSPERVNQLFRIAHNFKGSSRSVGFDALASFAHKLEDVLSQVKNGKLSPSQTVTSILLESMDVLRNYVQGLKSNSTFTLDTQGAVAKIEDLLNGRNADVATKAPAEEPAGFQIFDDPAPTPAPVRTPPIVVNTATAPRASAPSQNDELMRVSSRKLDRLLNLVGEIVVNQAFMNEFRSKNADLPLQAQKVIGYMEKLVTDIQDIAMTLRLVPVRPLFQKLQRGGRDAATALKKNVQIVLIGEHIEIDKTVLEKMTDPLVHMVRNAVDHGIEADAQSRVAAGKSAASEVKIEASQQDDRIVIRISDDGRGLNREQILKKAISSGIVKPNVQMSDDDVHALIFKPGFSTKEQVTDISGRGVGLEVVQKALEELKGTMQISTVPGKGTTFVVTLPLSLSVITGLVVGVNQQRFIIPVTQLTETVELTHYPMESSTGKGRMINLRGEIVPVLSLPRLLQGSRSPSKQMTQGPERRPAVVTEFRGKKISFEVDEVFGQQQIVLKKLGREFNNVPGVLGGAILSSGDPSIVLNLHDYLKGADLSNAA